MFQGTAENAPESCSLTDLGCWFWKWADFAIHYLQWLVESALSLLVFVVNSITNAFSGILPDLGLSIPPEVYYFVQPFNPQYGAGVIMTAYLARFFLRRVPIIG
ncbi:MAG: hypothetical protein P1U47_11980 [Zhongshania sp.]|uniref:hypothetical protein n=1 Tax=Zhongshania sp. TaxID=1971902 RepID=UPI00261B02B3|nr:hypothetical protein [Zhongshania sp.]MDF1693088.1 hypothetical protein [Zhongshania sp.]